MPTPSTSIETIKANLDADLRWRERRHPQWTTSHQLYRDTVFTNRLTQRQSVNVPLMKETIRTLLSDSARIQNDLVDDHELVYRMRSASGFAEPGDLLVVDPRAIAMTGELVIALRRAERFSW